MEKYINYFPVLFLSFCISLAYTPFVIYIAHRFGILDQPSQKRDSEDQSRARRIHKNPTPRLGGIPVIISFIFVSSLFLNPTLTFLGFAVTVIILLLVGVLDDVFEISANRQFIAQFMVAFLASLLLQMPFISALGMSLDLNWLEYKTDIINLSFPGDLFIIMWVIFLINSIKWSSGTDALMEGVVAIGALVIFLVSVRTFDYVSAIISVSLLGALLGFLPFNFAPAKIFSGSSGKSVYGFILAVLAIFSESKLAVTFAVTLIPAIDALTVLYFRQKNHKPKNFTELMRISDKTHLHHILLSRFKSHRKVALIEWSASFLVGALALIFAGAELAAVLLIPVLLLLLMGIRLRKNHTDAEK
jgi:UDP-GlcNAc:undecaprenyl-phosphate/decaprenyl-phosphate GlcNAc-1-phosphate transferase